MTFLKSRTFWTVVAMFFIGGVNAVADFIPAGVQPFVMAGLGVLATYFHVNPSRKY